MSGSVAGCLSDGFSFGSRENTGVFPERKHQHEMIPKKRDSQVPLSLREDLSVTIQTS
jgi:hypothetical protein